MADQVILDAGPLVAYLDKRQQHHAWAVSVFRGLTGHLLCCEAVITEACFLLAGQQPALDKIAEYLALDVIRLDWSLAESHPRVFSLMRKYADQPMSLADACLVCIAEDRPRAQVFTLDSDFAIYRLRNGRAVPRISPYK
jgi:uncharacterized protein